MKATVMAGPAAPPTRVPTTSPPATPAQRTQRILEGPILSTLLRLAAPNIVLVMVQALSSAVDAFISAASAPPCSPVSPWSSRCGR